MRSSGGPRHPAWARRSAPERRGTFVRLVKRVVVVLLIVAVVGVAAGAGALVWITNRAMPQTTGTLRVAGLNAAVTVQRDAAGFAHITATTPHDLFIAQGFVHAQERMWQMEVWRRISAG